MRLSRLIYPEGKFTPGRHQTQAIILSGPSSNFGVGSLPRQVMTYTSLSITLGIVL